MTDSDVVVVGGGPAGSACAAELSGSGHGVTLVDDGRRLGSWAGESLPPGGIGLITSVFGDDVIEGHRRAYGVRSAWGSSDLGSTDFVSTPLGDGLILDRVKFDEQARAHARSRGAAVISGRVQSFEADGDSWTCTLQDGRRLRSSWLVDATGRSASVASRLGARRTRADRLMAQVLAVPDRGEAIAGTIIESVPEGWWYSTPLPDGRRVIALLTDADLLPAEVDRGAQWRRALEETVHLRFVAGEITIDVEPALHRADTSVLHPMGGERWFAIGDAAAAWDPLSSQGVVSAVLAGARAGRAIPDPVALQTLESAVHLLVSEHAALQAHYYGLERRWPEEPFWHRRQT